MPGHLPRAGFLTLLLADEVERAIATTTNCAP
jgi:hypothetical protein